jgi:uncharacterized membrane protein YkoI
MRIILLLILSSMLSLSASGTEESKSGCKIISKAKAISAAQKSIEGKALSASLIESKGPPVYRVKVVLEGGRVKTILVDGCNGQVIRLKN